MQRIVWVVLALAIALQAATARAESPQVLIVMPSPADATMRKAQDDRVAQLRAELRASGFRVVEQNVDTALTPDALEAAARATQSFAVVVVKDEGPSAAAEVWVTDRITRTTVIRRIAAEEPGARGNRLVALRTVELLRASLLEVAEPSPDPEPPVEAPVPSEPSTELEPAPRVRVVPRARIVVPAKPRPERSSRPERVPEPPRFGIAGGASVIGGPGGLGPALAPAVAISWSPVDEWAGEAFVAAPGLGTLTDGDRAASTHQEMALLRVRYDPASAETPWSAYGWAGTGIYHLGASGDQDPWLQSRSEGRFALLASGGVGIRRLVFTGAAVLLELGAGWVTPRPVVRFAGERVGATGLPLLGATLAWELRW